MSLVLDVGNYQADWLSETVGLPPGRAVASLDFAKRRRVTVQRRFAQETPIVLEYNGIDYAVMLASPRDLEDYGVGFTLAEGLAGSIAEIGSIDSAEIDQGFVVRITIAHTEPLRDRLRLRLVEGSCGLCGLQSIEDVLRPLPRISARPRIDAEAIEAALRSLPDHQPVGRATGAMHAAAFCDADGQVLAVREDIGRHNALDKLTGHLARSGLDPAFGFILLSARCSYELVEKNGARGLPGVGHDFRAERSGRRARGSGRADAGRAHAARQRARRHRSARHLFGCGAMSSAGVHCRPEIHREMASTFRH